MGGARAAISWPEAMAATIWTVNPYRPAHLCRSLDMGDVQSSCGSEGVGVTIHTVWPKLGKLVGSEGVTVQQQREGHEGLEAVLGWV